MTTLWRRRWNAISVYWNSSDPAEVAMLLTHIDCSIRKAEAMLVVEKELG